MESPIVVRSRGHLPHWERDLGTYFVTFRLFDSLPAEILAKMKSEGESLLANARQLGRELTASEHHHLASLPEHYLDAGSGACWLNRPEIAGLVSRALQYFDPARYELHAWCVMPNHVHVAFTPTPPSQLFDIVHSWKSFTAHRSNLLLHRTGEFWQREYYDHLIRNQGDLARVVKYIMDNPTNAGLSNWPWISAKDEQSVR
ncbi:MAG: transposase [Acidobacteriales bacterium]|nr:transposase [Terriglobales bacterium]